MTMYGDHDPADRPSGTKGYGAETAAGIAIWVTILIVGSVIAIAIWLK